LILGKFPMNVPADHGTHVAGIIGADFDNADPANSGPANGRSGGVSGANPAAAHVYGIPWSFDTRPAAFDEISRSSSCC